MVITRCLWDGSKKDLYWTISRPEEVWISTNICILTNWTAALPSSKMQKAVKWAKGHYED